MSSYHGGAAGFRDVVVVIRGLELIVIRSGYVSHFFMEGLRINELNGVARKVKVLPDFWEVFFDVFSEPKVVPGETSRGLQNNLGFVLEGVRQVSCRSL